MGQIEEKIREAVESPVNALAEYVRNLETRIDALTTKIEEFTITSARLNTEIKNLENEVAANQEELPETLQAVMTDLTVRIGARVDERLQAIERQQPAAQPNVLARWLHR